MFCSFLTTSLFHNSTVSSDTLEYKGEDREGTVKYDPAPVPFFISRNLLWQHSLPLCIMRVDAFWNEDFLPSFIKNITKSVSLHEVIHESFYIMADHHFLRMYCASSDQMINISVSDRVYEVTCYIAVLVSCVFLFSLFSGYRPIHMVKQ